MGIKGSIKFGRRAEPQAISDLPARKARYNELVAESYAWSRAITAGTVSEVDDVIDPAHPRMAHPRSQRCRCLNANRQEASLGGYTVRQTHSTPGRRADRMIAQRDRGASRS